MYRSYNVHPYFVTDPNGDLDNMKQNIWDRTGQTMSPSDQGNDPADLDTSALIRKDILADKNLSINAQNVKIATSSGQVTLRGEVNSAFEKERIGKIANRMVQSQNVDNQLEVTPVTTSNN
jgi:osmotically-inducible protein OsmY